MLHSINIYRRLIGAQIRSQMQYRTSFLVEAFTTGLTTALEYGSLALVFYRFKSLGGWTLEEVAFLYGIAELSFGIMDLVFSGFDPGYFGFQVRRGTLDQLLLRPINITIQVLGSEFTIRRIGKILIGLSILVWALKINNIQWTPIKYLYLPLIIISQICFFGGLFIIGSAITFWTVESIEVVNIFTYGGSYIISYPMHIYPDLLRRFFTYIIPAAFLNYYPALYLLGKPDPFNLLNIARFLSPLIGLCMLCLALIFWHIGIRQYQSTGT
jgi:ABC-2 type transport system permease protein